MNKNLIQKFLIQSCWDEQDEIELEDWINVERFAELIVKECINISTKVDKNPYIPDSDQPKKIIREIKQHFGVEP